MSAPDLRLQAREALRVDGLWRILWRVTSLGRDQVRLVAVRAASTHRIRFPEV